jgi:FlaA1/EpsC-like NDP-sugar epimerase
MAIEKTRKILVTGACGTVGRGLLAKLLSDPGFSDAELVGIDNNESEVFFLAEQYSKNCRVSFFVADMRDRDRLCRLMRGVDLVFHAAALKHVVICERSPMEAVQTNILGVQNVIFAAIESSVSKVIFTSSDKAVNPTNVMGTSKLMGERLMTAANGDAIGSGTIFASTRFGNVLGSNGSVVQLFHRQIASGGPVTLTDNRMTRFVMSLNDAVQLVIDSVDLVKGGEVFITKMPVIRIEDLARLMIDELAPVFGRDPGAIEIQVIGAKPGEKLYEELMSSEETQRALELERYFSVLPAFRSLYSHIQYDYESVVSERVTDPYLSGEREALNKNQLRELLVTNSLLKVPLGGEARH